MQGALALKVDGTCTIIVTPPGPMPMCSVPAILPSPVPTVPSAAMLGP